MKKELVGYNCKKCKGKNFREDGDIVTHLCEGFAEPVFDFPTQQPELEKVRGEIYHIMDSFLTESKDQNGNERSIERLNQDRHLFVENIFSLLDKERERIVEGLMGMKKNTKTEFDVGYEMSTPRIIRDNGFNSALDQAIELVNIATPPSQSIQSSTTDKMPSPSEEIQ